MNGVSAVVVTYRTGSVLARCLEGLRADPLVSEIIIVDNGNPHETAIALDRLARQDSRVRISRPGRNIGFAGGCNRGAEMAAGPLLAFVNPDLIVPVGTFQKIAEVFAAWPGAWLAGGHLLDMDGIEQKGGRREVLTPWRAFVELFRLDRLAPNHPHFRRFNLLDSPAPSGIAEIPTVSGAFMAIPRDRYLALGGMDERMFLHVEDVDLCLRIHLAGGQVLFCGNVPLYHQKGSSDAPRWFVEWHKTRSSVIYFHKHFRSTYPRWSLHLIAALLVLRWLAVSVRALPSDIRARLGRRGAR
jgi:GT2 family glycosyltransferase